MTRSGICTISFFPHIWTYYIHPYLYLQLTHIHIYTRVCKYKRGSAGKTIFVHGPYFKSRNQNKIFRMPPPATACGTKRFNAYRNTPRHSHAHMHTTHTSMCECAVQKMHGDVKAPQSQLQLTAWPKSSRAKVDYNFTHVWVCVCGHNQTCIWMHRAVCRSSRLIRLQWCNVFRRHTYIYIGIYIYIFCLSRFCR